MVGIPPMVEALIDIVRAAGDEILDVYRGTFDVSRKGDDSPLTEADLRAHRVILDRLPALDADVPAVSEESEPPAFAERRRWRRYWLVDPLDGTKEFVARNGEFTVNVALVENGAPTLGVVGVPVQGRIYVGDRRAGGRGRAWRIDARGDRVELSTRRMGRRPPTVVASRRHGSERLAGFCATLSEAFGDVETKAVGSSLKFCLLAEGEADIYPRFGPTSEWDIAAAQAVLEAAGGRVSTWDGAPLAYNATASLLNPDFVAVADPAFPWAERLF